MSSLKILQEIKNGVTDPKSLSGSERKSLIPFLMAEGQSTAEIAHLLKVSDRTIERDKKAIRKDNALAHDPELTNIMAGKLQYEAQLSIQRIRKFQRDKDCTPATKIDAEHRCFQIASTLSERLQSLGFLKTATAKIEADLTHHLENPLSLDELESELKHLQEIEKSTVNKDTKKIESITIKHEETES
jgi:hypothetical protein